MVYWWWDEGVKMMVISICDDEEKLRAALKKVVEIELLLQGIEFELREYASGEEL